MSRITAGSRFFLKPSGEAPRGLQANPAMTHGRGRLWLAGPERYLMRGEYPAPDEIGSFRYTSPLRILRLNPQSGLLHTQSLVVNGRSLAAEIGQGQQVATRTTDAIGEVSTFHGNPPLFSSSPHFQGARIIAHRNGVHKAGEGIRDLHPSREPTCGSWALDDGGSAIRRPVEAMPPFDTHPGWSYN